jgi:hypothetical protein
MTCFQFLLTIGIDFLSGINQGCIFEVCVALLQTLGYIHS